MKRATRAGMAVLLSLALLLSGCGSANKQFVYYISAAPKVLDPQLADSATQRSVILACFEGLLRLDAEGTPQPAAAERYEVSSNGLVYTFYLKQNLAFRTVGSKEAKSIPITADDFVFGLQRVFMPETKSPYAGVLSAISGSAEVQGGADIGTLGVKALNASTVQITLSQPNANFLAALCTAGAMPCNRTFFAAAKGAYGRTLDTLLCNGPYDLTVWSEANGLTFTLRDNSVKRRVQKIRLPIDDGSKTGAQRLAEGTADACLTSADVTVKNCTEKTFSTTTWVLLLNCKNPALQNASVRRALSGVAGEQLASLSAVKPYIAADGLFPPSVTMDGTPFRKIAGTAAIRLSGAEALALYREGLAALSLEKIENLTVLVPKNETLFNAYTSVNQAFQKELSAFFAVEQLAQDEIAKRVASGEYDIALVNLSAQSNDIGFLLLPYASNNAANFSGYSDAQYDSLVRGFTEAAYKPYRQSLAVQAEARLLSDGVVIPFYYEESSFWVASWVKSITVSAFGPVVDLSSVVG